jgi:hypothetical protein
MRAAPVQEITFDRSQTTGRPWNDNAFLYAAYQTAAQLIGAQGADAARYSLQSWRGDRSGTTAYVRTDGENFAGSVHGVMKIGFETKSRAFVPDAQPASRGGKANGAGASGAIADPLTYAASQTIAELAGAQASGAASYRILDWRGDQSGVTGRVRVDVDSFTGSYHGVVNVQLEKKEAYLIPDAEPAATFTRSGR